MSTVYSQKAWQSWTPGLGSGKPLPGLQNSLEKPEKPEKPSDINCHQITCQLPHHSRHSPPTKPSPPYYPLLPPSTPPGPLFVLHGLPSS